MWVSRPGSQWPPPTIPLSQLHVELSEWYYPSVERRQRNVRLRHPWTGVAMASNGWKFTALLCLSILAALPWTVFFALAALTGCKRIDKSLTRGLEEEKSYTRHAMEYHREHPDNRRGNSVLDAWSAADYIALDVAKQKLKGEWAKSSDQLSFLPTDLKADSGGRPFCVIQRDDAIIVLRFLDKTAMDCTLDTARQLDISNIHSGDMEFSGRTDYWAYVLKRPVAQ